MDGPTGRVRRPRSDGIASRARILAAAGEVFGDQGLEAPMDHVATRAGVAGATLYRHFATREALVEALLRDRYSDLTEAIAREGASGGSAFDIFAAALRSTARVSLANYAFMQSLVAHHFASVVIDRLRIEFYARLALLAEAAQRAGDMRADFAPGDLPLIMRSIVLGAPTRSPSCVAELLDRHIDIVLDGLRARSASGQLGRSAPSLDEAVASLSLPDV